MMYMEGFEQSPVVSILNVVINILSNEKLISVILTNAYMYFIPYQYIGYIHCSNNSTKKTWNKQHSFQKHNFENMLHYAPKSTSRHNRSKFCL